MKLNNNLVFHGKNKCCHQVLFKLPLKFCKDIVLHYPLFNGVTFLMLIHFLKM